MHLAERIKVFLAMRRVKREGKHLLLKFKSRPHGVFGVWYLLKLHCEKWVQKSPEALRHPGFLGWHPLRMHNMARSTEKDITGFLEKTACDKAFSDIFYIFSRSV